MARFALPMDGGRVDRMMMAAGMTPGDLAAAAGVSEATVSRARNGRPMSRTSYVAIATTLARYERDPAVVALFPDA